MSVAVASCFPSSCSFFKVHQLMSEYLTLPCLQILVHLFTIWSVDVKCFVAFRQVSRLEDATLVKVVPHAFVGTKEVVPIETKTVVRLGLRKELRSLTFANSVLKHASFTESTPSLPLSDPSIQAGEPHVSFAFRKLRFIWDQGAGAFRKLQYPTRLTFAEYRASTGHGREEAVAAATERWGPNRFEVPVPAFLDLLKEQLVAPFFCFQVFCVALWALDEFWYYSIMTLFMLVTFESTVVHQRLRNLAQVRALQQPRQPLKVYRCGKWIELPGESLVPGDVVSLARPPGADDVVVQADMLLLAGTCIVDEAVLTGESTPQWKNPVGEATGDEVDASELAPTAHLSVKRDKMHVVFGGTKLLQMTGDNEAHIRTPDGGCLAVVLRTGFGTAQGEGQAAAPQLCFALQFLVKTRLPGLYTSWKHCIYKKNKDFVG